MEISIDVCIHKREYHTVKVEVDCHDEQISGGDDLCDYISEHIYAHDYVNHGTMYDSDIHEVEQGDIDWDEADWYTPEDQEDLEAYVPLARRPIAPFRVNADTFFKG